MYVAGWFKTCTWSSSQWRRCLWQLTLFVRYEFMSGMHCRGKNRATQSSKILSYLYEFKFCCTLFFKMQHAFYAISIRKWIEKREMRSCRLFSHKILKKQCFLQYCLHLFLFSFSLSLLFISDEHKLMREMRRWFKIRNIQWRFSLFVWCSLVNVHRLADQGYATPLLCLNYW